MPGGTYGSYYNYQSGAGIVSDIKIYGKDEYDEWRSLSNIFSTTCHEFAHVIHCVYTPSRYREAMVRYLEAWARCFQYYVTMLEYEELGVLGSLNVVSTSNSIISPDLEYNFQLWNKEEYSLSYPTIFIDVLDNYNQSRYAYSIGTSYPVDNVYYPNMKALESIVLNSTTFDEVREELLLRANLITPGLSRDDINTLFDYYEY